MSPQTPTRRKGAPLFTAARSAATRLLLAATALLATLAAAPLLQAAQPARPILVQAVLASGAEQEQLVESLAQTGDPIVETFLAKWRGGDVFIYTAPDGERTPLEKQAAELTPKGEVIYLRVSDGEPLLGADGEPLQIASAALTAAQPSRQTRRAFTRTIDLIGLRSETPAVRAEAARKLGLKQQADYLVQLEQARAGETVRSVTIEMEKAIAIAQIALGDKTQQMAAVSMLSEHNSIAGLDVLKRLKRDIERGNAKHTYTEAEAVQIDTAIASIEGYIKWVDFFGTLFRGMSLGSVLLIVALGLAITFGLMGIINMAHGEMIAVGAYAAYLSQLIFVALMPTQKAAIEWYFIFAIPFSFLLAALCGLVLERSIIRFLYKRPLESLLATWGVSLILQQAFRLIFGAANRQVNSPSWLMGNFTLHDVSFGYNRLFVIVFAALIVLGTWLLMTRTPLGLCIRAVMQDPKMAAAMGIRTDRVRMMTFTFGSGLAGLAGVFLSQIGSVGANLGQSYIVDSFMVVVAGGVGNIIGTVISALGIGVVDQSLQPFIGPVMGRVTVLVAIILFLQFKPGGLFPARSRSLD